MNALANAAPAPGMAEVPAVGDPVVSAGPVMAARSEAVVPARALAPESDPDRVARAPE